MLCEKGVPLASADEEAGVVDAGDSPPNGVLAMIFLVRISSGGEVSSTCSTALPQAVA